MADQPPTTNEELAGQLDAIQAEVQRTPETIAAIVQASIADHEQRIPHSAITELDARAQIARIGKLEQTSQKLIELLEGKVELDLRGNPQLVEPGIVHTIEKILRQTNGGQKVHVPKPAWVVISATFIATVIELLTK